MLGSITPFPPLNVRSKPLQIADIPIPSDGFNQELGQHVLPNSQCKYLVDILLDIPGFARRRGEVAYPSGGPGSFLGSGNRVHGICSLGYGSGATRVAFLYTATDGSHLNTGNLFAKVYNYVNGVTTSVGTVTIPIGTNLAIASHIMCDARPALGNGVLIGAGASFDFNAAGALPLTYWRGAGKADYAVGTITITASSAVVTGSGTTWSTNLEPGMFLFVGTTVSDSQFAGTIKSVDSNTQVTLEHNVLTGASAGLSYFAKSFRGLAQTPWITTGTITVASGATVVNGGGTHFSDQNVGAAGLYRANDMVRIGSVASVQSNTQLTLAAGAAVAMANEEYVLIHTTTYENTPSTRPMGWLGGLWKGYQFLANQGDSVLKPGGPPATSRVSILGPSFVDEMDVSKTGTYLDLPASKTGASGPITGVMPTETAMLVFRQRETHSIFGTSPDDFIIKPLYDDGCISPMTAQSYNGGAIWAGTKGVYFYDGVSITNLLKDRAQAWYLSTAFVANAGFFSWGMIVNDHYFLFLENSAPADLFIAPYIQPGEKIVLVINLKTGSLTTATNMWFRGAASVEPNKTWAISNSGAYKDTTSNVLLVETLFSTPANVSDSFSTTINATLGPQPYIQTKLYDFGSAERKKLFKQLQMWLRNDNSVSVGVFSGVVPDTPTVLTVTANAWRNVRSKFLRRSTHLGFHIFTGTNPGAFLIGAMAVGFKSMRAGRV